MEVGAAPRAKPVERWAWAAGEVRAAAPSFVHEEELVTRLVRKFELTPETHRKDVQAMNRVHDDIERIDVQRVWEGDWTEPAGSAYVVQSVHKRYAEREQFPLIYLDPDGNEVPPPY